MHEDERIRETFGGKSLSEVLHGRFDKLPPDREAAIVKAREMSPDKRAGYNLEFFSLCFGPEANKLPHRGGK